jgi:predicted DNA-binding WGR domain protein
MRLVCTENGANKFWEGSVDGRTLRVRFGRMGTAGQSKGKELATPEAAERELARLVAEKRRKGYRAEGGAGGEGPGIPAATLAGKPLLELAALLGRDQARSLIEEVELASSAPETYVTRFSERLEGRGIRTVRPELAWFALIDGLLARRLMTEIDWKESSEEVMEHLLPLDPGGKRTPWKAYLRACVALDPATEPMAADYLDVAGDGLRARGLGLICLEISGDSSPVTILPAAELERALSLVRDAGLGAIIEMKTRPGATLAPPRLDIPAAPTGTPSLRIAGTVVVQAPRSAVRGFFALPGDRAVMLTVWGADRRWYLWLLSPDGVTGQPVDAGLFPSWSALPAVDHFCALFRSGERFGLMSDDEFRLWDAPGAAPRLGRVTPPLFRSAYRRAPNVSFGGASDDPRVVVVSYFTVGSLQESPLLARLELAEASEHLELRHVWLKDGAPIVPRRQPPAAEGSRAVPFPTLTAVGHARGATFVVSPVRGPGRMMLASVASDGLGETLFEVAEQGGLTPTSCGRFLIVTEEAPPRARRLLYSPVERGYVFPFDPDSLPPNLRLCDREGETWWALDVEAAEIRLSIARAG